ncbi:hypothetical protein G6F65_014397 [Rhizopus arrhizus]|nr:hypothetical protein G6F65_014397 [Rhizopus arrhizus]
MPQRLFCTWSRPGWPLSCHMPLMRSALVAPSEWFQSAVGGLLADQVDGTGRCRAAVVGTGRALGHLHLFDVEHIARDRAQVAHTVHIQTVGGVKATHEQRVAGGGVAVLTSIEGAHAGAVAQRFGQRGGALLVEQVAGDHLDGLRGVLQTLGELRRGHLVGLVAAGGVHIDLVQGARVVAGLGVGQRGKGRQAEAGGKTGGGQRHGTKRRSVLAALDRVHGRLQRGNRKGRPTQAARQQGMERKGERAETTAQRAAERQASSRGGACEGGWRRSGACTAGAGVTVAGASAGARRGYCRQSRRSTAGLSLRLPSGSDSARCIACSCGSACGGDAGAAPWACTVGMAAVAVPRPSCSADQPSTSVSSAATSSGHPWRVSWHSVAAGAGEAMARGGVVTKMLRRITSTIMIRMCAMGRAARMALRGPGRVLSPFRQLHPVGWLPRGCGDSVAVVAGPDGGAAIAHVEARAVQHALHAALGGVELAGGQLELFMRALVLQRIQLAIEVEHHDRGAGYFVEHALHFTRQQFGAGTDEGPGLAHAVAPASGFSRTSKRRSSRLGMPKRSSPYGNGFLMPVRW